MAKAMCCDMVPARDIFRAADLAGNGMHFTTVAIAPIAGTGMLSTNGLIDSVSQ